MRCLDSHPEKIKVAPTKYRNAFLTISLHRLKWLELMCFNPTAVHIQLYFQSFYGNSQLSVSWLLNKYLADPTPILLFTEPHQLNWQIPKYKNNSLNLTLNQEMQSHTQNQTRSQALISALYSKKIILNWSRSSWLNPYVTKFQI